MPKHNRVEDSDESGSDTETQNLDDMTFAQLKEAYRTAQLEKNIAEKEMRHALGDISNCNPDPSSPTPKKKTRRKRPTKRRHIEAESSDKGNGADSPDDSGNDSDTDDKKKVQSLGHRFVLLKSLWLKPDIFETKLEENYDEKKRFDGAEVQGQLRDILAIIPDRYKGNVMRTGWFERAFLSGMQDQRCNTSTRIRRQAGHSIYDCATGDLLTADLRRQFRKEIGWNGEEYTSLDVPILHEDGSAEFDIHTCFLSPVPMRLFVALIRGPSAAAAMLKSVKGAVIPKTDNMERIHRIDHSEPGAIAAACTLAIWGKSMDVQLKARGDTTNINYEARFEEYLDILLTGLRKKTPSILNIFSEWDRIIFPDAKASHVDPERKTSKSDGYKRAMEAMRAEAPSDGGRTARRCR
ncbi:hypothetical protein MVEN_02201900 [Mycena venus]|uniref:Uncharacterized protein n=1 Tax=Mycena venus TaxID=2733690 RepID=A0A8H7CF91_9AGAR|nr:hypothetical protein MVEN_02201900 [Mycena venus]